MDGGDVDGIPEEIMDETGLVNESHNPSMINDMGKIDNILQQDQDLSNDIPPPESTVQQNFSKPTILESMKTCANNVVIGKKKAWTRTHQLPLKFLPPKKQNNQFQNFLKDFFPELRLNCFQHEKEISLYHG